MRSNITVDTILGSILGRRVRCVGTYVVTPLSWTTFVRVVYGKVCR